MRGLAHGLTVLPTSPSAVRLSWALTQDPWLSAPVLRQIQFLMQRNIIAVQERKDYNQTDGSGIEIFSFHPVITDRILLHNLPTTFSIRSYPTLV